MGEWEANSLVGQNLGQFDVKSELGRGGMAVVYKGYQQSLDRWVAIKTLPKEFAGNRDMVSRFHREAEAMVVLNHTNIVQIIDKGEDKGLYYFAMEFVEGPSLKELLKNETLSMDLMFDIALQVCDGLSYAHKKGIVHRDIKPANVFWETSTSLAKIGDFGIARLTEKPLEMITLTAANVGMGTMNYMAPEQKTDAGGVDHRADIYSTGVMIYEMFTGKLPMGRFKMPSQLNSALPRKLDELVARCLETDPEDRYPDMAPLREDLTAARKAAEGGTLVRSVRDAAERTLTAVADGGRGGKLAVVGCLLVSAFIGVGGAGAVYWSKQQQIAGGNGSVPPPTDPTPTDPPPTDPTPTDPTPTDPPPTDPTPTDPTPTDPPPTDPPPTDPTPTDPTPTDPTPTDPTPTVTQIPNPTRELQALSDALAKLRADATAWNKGEALAQAFATAQATVEAAETPTTETASELSTALTALRTAGAKVFVAAANASVSRATTSSHRRLRDQGAAARRELERAASGSPSKRLTAARQALTQLTQLEVEELNDRVRAAADMARLRMGQSQIEATLAKWKEAPGQGTPLATKRSLEMSLTAFVALREQAPIGATYIEPPKGKDQAEPLTDRWASTLAGVTSAGAGRFGLLARRKGGSAKIYVVRGTGAGLQRLFECPVHDHSLHVASAGLTPQGNLSFWVTSSEASGNSGSSRLVRYTFSREDGAELKKVECEPINDWVYALAAGADGRVYLALRKKVLIYTGEQWITRRVDIGDDYNSTLLIPRRLAVLRDGGFALTGVVHGATSSEKSWTFRLGVWNSAGDPQLVNAGNVNPSGITEVGGSLLAIDYQSNFRDANLYALNDPFRDPPQPLLEVVKGKPFKGLSLAVSGDYAVALDVRAPEKAVQFRPFAAILRVRAQLYRLRR